MNVKIFPVSPAKTKRPYGGKSADERRAGRRAMLLEAARGLWCEHGWTAVTVRGVCARAALADRYFYESFADRSAILVAVGDEVRGEAMTLILEAVEPHLHDSPRVQLEAAVTAVVEFVAADPGSTQIFFGDHGGSELLESLRRTMIASVVDVFLAFSDDYREPGFDERDFRIALLVGIGGFVETVGAWRSGAIEATSEELVASLMRLADRMVVGLVRFA